MCAIERPLRGAWTTILFLANALLFIAIAVPPTLPPVVMGAVAVIAVNVLCFGVDARLRIRARSRNLLLVGAVGFEPTTSCSQSTCANQASLRPVFHSSFTAYPVRFHHMPE